MYNYDHLGYLTSIGVRIAHLTHRHFHQPTIVAIPEHLVNFIFKIIQSVQELLRLFLLEGVSDERGESRFSTFSLVVFFILAKKAVLISTEAPGEQKQIFLYF